MFAAARSLVHKSRAGMNQYPSGVPPCYIVSLSNQIFFSEELFAEFK